MLYTVNYTKKNTFMSVKGTPEKRRITAEGEIVDEGKYTQPTVPGASRVYRPKYSLRKRRYLVNLSQEELNALVKEMHLYEDNGAQIVDAPLTNESAPFWKHVSTSLYMENMSATLDDENPRDKFFIKCFESDPQFKMLGDEVNPAIAANVRFTIAKAEENVAKIDQATDQSMKAAELLNAMDYEKQVNILRAMGIDSKNPDPKVVKNTLFRRITEEKNLRNVTGGLETNIEAFLRLATTTSEDLNLQGLIERARQSRVINKAKDGKYKFGQITLGKNLSEVREYLGNVENADILDEILDKCQ